MGLYRGMCLPIELATALKDQRLDCAASDFWTQLEPHQSANGQQIDFRYAYVRFPPKADTSAACL